MKEIILVLFALYGLSTCGRLENVGYSTLFPYAAIFVFGSFVTMGFVRHGDNRVEAKKGLEAFDVDD